jgi:hypothetical protein
VTAPWAAQPPELNDSILKGGPGEATTVASGASWQAQTIAALTHAGISHANTAATSAGWIGAGGVASAAGATQMNTVLTALSGWAQAKVPITETAASAYRLACSTMFPAPVCTENRVEQAHSVAINPLVLGALTPQIVRLDGTYFGPYWMTNAGAGITYSAALTGLLGLLAIPPPVGSLPVSPGAPATAAEAVSEATATGGAGEAMRASEQAGTQLVGQVGQQAGAPLKSAQSAMEPLSSLAQAPMGAAQSLSSPLESATSPLSSVMGMFTAAGAPGLTGSATQAELGAAAAAPGSAVGGAGIGAGGGGVGSAGYAGAGLTSYTRPTSSFTPDAEARGAASYARPGAARPGGVASAPITGPVTPMGMLRPTDKDGDKTQPATARLSAIPAIPRS